jgi:hypothetical protein
MPLGSELKVRMDLSTWCFGRIWWSMACGVRYNIIKFCRLGIIVNNSSVQNIA